MADETRTPGYTSEDLLHLSDREHVRERFGMYIGDNTSRGLHHLVYDARIEPQRDVTHPLNCDIFCACQFG